MTVVYDTLFYLGGSLHLGLFIPANNSLHLVADADKAKCLDTLHFAIGWSSS